MHTTFFILLGIFLTANVVRTVYELLKGAGRADPNNNVLFAFIFLGMCALWISWFAMGPLDPVPAILPLMVRWIGLTLVLVGVAIAVGALIQLKGLENIKSLRTTGLYVRLRHPMYTGFILWILGWAAYHGAIVSLCAGVAGIANILWWRRMEEEHLLRQFGEAYRQYRRQTWC